MPKADRAAARNTDVSRELGVWNAFSDTAFDGRVGDGAGGTAARAYRGKRSGGIELSCADGTSTGERIELEDDAHHGDAERDEQ
jgi:hypothetical protein